ncbi:MAG: ornithine/acetylornithine aminotransferase [Anaerolineaceae bacterium]|nr:MAG: ornithine/acetylornithine aminotransferase [Anaerolineaceae bacterium]
MSFSLSQLIQDRQADQYDLHMKYISPHMARVQHIIGFDKIYTRGEGAYLWDADGVRYLDLLAGYSVFNLGRGHPAIKQAMMEYLSLNRPTLVKMDCPLLAGLLAEELVKRMPPGLDAIFFANSGADAVDTAIKFARYAAKRPRVIYLDHSFHGLTLGTLSINGGEAFKKGFDPLIPGAVMVAMNDLEALEKELRKGDVAAFIVEPIQGKGVYIPEDNYLPEAQRLCRKYGAQFICDEVQMGLGRAGKFLCCEHWNLEPDMVTIAKSLGGGYAPVSAVIMRREINNKVFGHLKRAQVHSTTFGQNDMGMAAGLATLHVMDEEKIVERSATLGAKLLAGLVALKDKHEMIADVRGKGLVIGIEFRPPTNLAMRAAWTAIEAAEKGLFTQLVVMSLMRDHHMMTQVGGPGVNIIKLLPPLIIGDEEVDAIVQAFDTIMDETKNLKGRVWATSGELIKQAMTG